MHHFRSSTLLTTALSAFLSLTALSPVAAAPTPQASSSPSSGYWLANTAFHRNDPVWGNSNTQYPLFRDVTDTQYGGGGAKGDGVTDDTDAINFAINATLGNDLRCGLGCNSSTITPALVYFPPGTYLVSSPIIMEYYTQIVGDAINPPTIVASSDFVGIAVLDSDPYGADGNWYINQNNFFRQVRNLIIDITQWSGGSAGAAIHWQVAQATSLQNIVFEMSTDSATKQVGIYMDNGSGGFMSDLTFNGGEYGAFLGNQQFTSRNMVFNGCQTGIFMNWNWGWTLSNMTFNGCGIGVDMSNSPTNQTVGSVVLSDSTYSGTTQAGIKSAYSTSGDVPATGGTLIIDNVDFGSATNAVVGSDGTTAILSGGGSVGSWASGNVYDHSGTATATQGTISAPNKATSLLLNGNIFGRSKPQYETSAASDFLRSKSDGKCAGDGSTDDTTCIQNFLQQAASASQIAYFDHGVYVVSDTIQVPATIQIVGEVWSTILASGFSDGSNPKPVWEVGTPGQTGAVEISDMLFEIEGPNPGAIMVQWNLNSDQGASGMWDTHIRMGGSYGSELQLSECPSTTTAVSDSCIGGFLMFYASPQSSGVYLENTWFWTADHDMEDPLNLQISIYNGRGMLIQSQGPVWLWGTSVEHSVLYNYQFDGVQALFAGFMQSETPYYQPQPLAPSPFSFNENYDDPEFTICSNSSSASTDTPCEDSWGLRVVNSQNVLIYSTGFYSFFNSYSQDCIESQNCQLNMIHIQNSQVDMFAVTTIATQNMLVDDAAGYTIAGAGNLDVYGDTLAVYFTGS